MQVATLVIAVAGVTLAALSLGWQAATFVLTGGRVKVELRVGAMHGTASHMVTQSVSSGLPDPERLQADGYTRPVVAVQVRNVGRMAVTVEDWSLFTSPGSRIALQPVGQSIGPPLPHRLEAGATGTWAVELAPVRAMRAATVAALKVPEERIKIRGKVGLGDGRTVETREAL